MNLVKLKKGKTSNIYYGNYLLIEKTNRVSVDIPGEVVNKGLIHNQMSNMWMNMTSHIIPNHILSTDPRVLLILGANPNKKGCISAVKKCIPLPFECIVRGYYIPTSKSWDSYRTSGHINGIALPKGLKEAEALPYPIFTPSTKEQTGHDKNISFDAMQLMMYNFVKNLLGTDDNALHDDYYAGFASSICKDIRKISIELYEFSHNYALDKGVIIADTKFEFGLDYDLNLILIDEMLTPDTTRYWDADKYEVGQIQSNLSTHFLRDYIHSLGWYGNGPAPEIITEDILQATSEVYSDLYQKLFGKKITSLIDELSIEWGYYI